MKLSPTFLSEVRTTPLNMSGASTLFSSLNRSLHIKQIPAF